MNRRIIIIALLVVFPVAAWSAPPKLRPGAGIGILLIPLSSDTEHKIVPFYKAPGVERIREIRVKELPRLSVLTDPSPEVIPLSVTGKKGTWLKAEWDEAGHGGWLAPERSWRYVSWDVFLPGRSIRMLPGLQKMHYVLRDKPGVQGSELLVVDHQVRLLVARVEDDWLFAERAGTSGGWLRWRDDNGRFLISIDAAGIFP